MMADQSAGFDIFISHLCGFRIGCRHALRRRNPAQRLLHLAQRPVEIYGRWSCRGQRRAGAFQSGVGGIVLQRQANAVSSRDADQRRAANLHDFDGAGSVGKRLERERFKGVGKARLVDDADRTVAIVPDRTVMNPANFHVSLPRASAIQQKTSFLLFRAIATFAARSANNFLEQPAFIWTRISCSSIP